MNLLILYHKKNFSIEKRQELSCLHRYVLSIISNTKYNII